MAETSQQSNKPSNSNSNRDSPSVQQPRNDFAELESSLPPLPDIGRSLPSQGPLDLDQGVSPSDVNPLAASLALASNTSTPVPAPIERFGMNRPPLAASAWNLFPSGQRTPASPPLIPIPSEVQQENSAVPMEGVVSTRQFDLAKAMLDHQWALFVVAQEARDVNLMRMALNQAIPSQDLLTNLVGREEMLRISEDWVARDELAHLDRSMSNSSDNLTPTQVSNPTGPPIIPTSSHPTEPERTPSDPRDPIPGTYPLCDARETTTATSTAESTAYFTPGVPGTTRRVETGYGSSNLRQPTTSTPLWLPRPPAPVPSTLRSSSPAKPLSAPLRSSPPPRRREPGSRKEARRPHHEDGSNGRVIQPCRENSGSYVQDSWSRKAATKPVLSPISESGSSPISSPLDRHNIPSIDSFSNPSLKENFLNNLNSQFVPDTTFLIEDRLKDVFQQFLSQLSSTIHSFPHSVFHSCINEFKTTMNKSMNEMIMSEIVPTLISEVLNHLKDDENKEVVSVNIKNEIEPLKEFVKEHVETVQDILHVNDSQMQANIEQVRHDLKELTQNQKSQYTSLMEHLSSINEHENHRFEQIKRRLGDVGQTMNNLQTKIISSVVPEPKEQPLICTTIIPS
ncbi:hypothetical protein KEM48_005980 [Puccinia striiformis f. sp. tritici PST-130]|nr:hypothetical protein KEM48_005980 [Puccinia striiformis f. sp. tritici PST-130]